MITKYKLFILTLVMDVLAYHGVKLLVQMIIIIFFLPTYKREKVEYKEKKERTTNKIKYKKNKLQFGNRGG